MRMEACFCWTVQFKKKIKFYGFYVFFPQEPADQIATICSRFGVSGPVHQGVSHFLISLITPLQAFKSRPVNTRDDPAWFPS